MNRTEEQNSSTQDLASGSSFPVATHSSLCPEGGVHVAPRCQLHVHHATWCCSGDVRMSGLSCLDMSGIVLVGLMVSIPLESTTNGNIRPFCQPIIGGSLHLDILYIYIYCPSCHMSPSSIGDLFPHQKWLLPLPQQALGGLTQHPAVLKLRYWELPRFNHLLLRPVLQWSLGWFKGKS
jgi:hypothetical protein